MRMISRKPHDPASAIIAGRRGTVGK